MLSISWPEWLTGQPDDLSCTGEAFDANFFQISGGDQVIRNGMLMIWQKTKTNNDN